jgi:hypothetical protein
VKKLLIILPFLLLALACSTFPWSNSASSTSQPAIVAFTATPSVITAGQTATLMWNVTNATSVQIDQGVGSGLAVAGTVTVAPAATTNYILTASNSAGSITNSATVTVSNIMVFDISPNTINIPPGTGPHQATMRWEVRNAAAVYINGSPVALNGSQILTRGLGTHTYVLRAINPAGEETRTQVLHVNP